VGLAGLRKVTREAISTVKTAASFSKRNPLVHSALAAEDGFARFAFYYRTVDDAYKVQPNFHTSDTFHEHVWKFRDLVSEAMQALGVTEEDVTEYGRGAQFEDISP
jgi:hypothetical protein